MELGHIDHLSQPHIVEQVVNGIFDLGIDPDKLTPGLGGPVGGPGQLKESVADARVQVSTNLHL